MNRLAKAIQLAAKLREESYDNDKERKETQDFIDNRGTPLNYNSCYTLSLYQACDKAADAMGFDIRGTQPIYLLLKNSWNEALEWAEKYKGE